MKQVLATWCLILTVGSLTYPMIAVAQINETLPFEPQGQPIKLTLPKALAQQIEQGNFMPGKTPPDQISPWLQASTSEETHLIALQFLDLSHTDSQTIIVKVLQTGSEKEIGFLGQKLLRLNKANAVNMMLTVYPLTADKNQKQSLLHLLGSTRDPRAWPLLITYYLKLGREINFLSPQKYENDILFINQLAQLMRGYSSDELVKSFSPLLDGDFSSQILALKLLYPLNHPPAIVMLRKELGQSDPDKHRALIRELFAKPSGKIIYNIGIPVPIFDVEAISDREIFIHLLKDFVHDITGDIHSQSHPFWNVIGRSLGKNPDFASLLTPYLSQADLNKPIKDQLFNLYFQYKKLEKSDLALLQNTSPESLNSLVYQHSSHPEQLKALFSDLILSKYPPVIAATLQIFKNDPEALVSARSLTHHTDEDVRLAAWRLIGSQRPELLRSLATEDLNKEKSPKVKAEIIKSLLINRPAAEQVQFAIDHILATEDLNLSSMLKNIFAKSFELSNEDQPQGIEKLSPLLQRSEAVQSALLDVYLEQRYIPAAEGLKPLIASENNRLTAQALNVIRLVSPAWEEYGSLIEPILASKDRQLAESALEAWNNLRYQSPEGWQKPLLQLLAAAETDAFVRNKIFEVTLAHDISEAEPYLLQTLAEQAKASSSTYYPPIYLNNVRHFQHAQELLPYLNGSESQAYSYNRFNPENFLKENGSDELLPELKRLLPTFNQEGQSSIIRILGQLGDRPTIDLIRPFLNASNKSLQSSAREAFLQLGGQFQEEEAQRILATEDTDTQKLRGSILAKLSPDKSYPLLRSDMRSLDAQRRATAIHLATFLNARALFPEMLNAMGDDLIRDYAIGCFGFSERSDALMSLVSFTDASNYKTLLEFLDQKELHRLDRAGSMSGQQEIADRLEPEVILKDFAVADQDRRAKLINLFANSLDPAWKPTLLKFWQDERDPELKERLLALLGELKTSEVQPVLLSHMASNHLALSYLAYMRSPEAKEYLLKLYQEDSKNHAWTLSLLRLYQDERIAHIFAELKRSEDPKIRQQITDLESFEVPSFVKFAHSWQSESIRPPRRPLEETYTFAELYEQIQHYDLDRTRERMLPLARAAKNPEQKQLAVRLLSTFLTCSKQYPPQEAANALMELGTQEAQASLLELLLHDLKTYRPDNTLDRVRDYLLHANLQTLQANIQTLIPHISMDEVAELRLLHVQALGLQQKSQDALDEINQLKNEPHFRAHPARLLKLIHLQSDFLPAQERAGLLNQDAAKLLETFTFRENKLYPDAEFNHQIRILLALLKTGQTTSAREQLARMFSKEVVKSQISYLPVGVPLIQFMISESWLMDKQPEQAIPHILHGLRLMSHGAGDYSGLLNVRGLESLPFQASFSSEYDQLMKLLAAEPERQTYFKEYFTYPGWYPSSLSSLFNPQ